MAADTQPREDSIAIECAVCGNDEVRTPDGQRVRCPSCEETFSLSVTDRFALVERDGWAVHITLDVPDTVRRPVDPTARRPRRSR